MSQFINYKEIKKKLQDSGYKFQYESGQQYLDELKNEALKRNLITKEQKFSNAIIKLINRKNQKYLGIKTLIKDIPFLKRNKKQINDICLQYSQLLRHATLFNYIHILRLFQNNEQIPNIADKKYYDFILSQLKKRSNNHENEDYKRQIIETFQQFPELETTTNHRYELIKSKLKESMAVNIKKDVQNSLIVQFNDKLKTYLKNFLYSNYKFEEKYSLYKFLQDFCNEGEWNDQTLQNKENEIKQFFNRVNQKLTEDDIKRNLVQTLKCSYFMLSKISETNKYLDPTNKLKGFKLLPISSIKLQHFDISPSILQDQFRNDLQVIQTEGDIQQKFQKIFKFRKYEVQGLSTDGTSVTVLVQKPIKYQKVSDKFEEIQKIYNKQNTCILGIDTGITNIATISGIVNDEIKTWTLTSSHFYNESGINSQNQKIGYKRNKQGIKQIDQEMNSLNTKTTDIQQLLQYFQKYVEVQDKLWKFHSSLFVPKVQFKRYQMKQKFYDKICNEIKQYFQKIKITPIISYGITRHFNKKGTKSVPSSKLYNIFKRHFDTYVVSEYKTTQIHYETQTQSKTVYTDKNKEKRKQIQQNKRILNDIKYQKYFFRKQSQFYDEQKLELFKEQRKLNEKIQLRYSLRKTKEIPNHMRGLRFCDQQKLKTFNRDINASLNIMKILQHALNCGDYKTRPEALSYRKI